MSRCVGHCCRRFAMEHSVEELQADHRAWLADPASSRIPDVALIAPMVISLGSSRDGREHVYTCRNLRPNGDCGIYETRPRMCRDFPGPEGCHFRGCRSARSAYSGMPWWRRWATRYRWLRSLGGRS